MGDRTQRIKGKFEETKGKLRKTWAPTQDVLGPKLAERARNSRERRRTP